MGPIQDDEQQLIRYLLGELPPEAQERLEEQLFADPELADRIDAVETDLVDDYVRQELPEDLRRRFESGYLASRARQDRVRRARAEIQVLSESASSSGPGQAAVPGRPAAQVIPPVWRFAMAAVILLSLAATVWLGVERRRLNNQLTAFNTERQAWEREERALREDRATRRQELNRLASQLQSEREERSNGGGQINGESGAGHSRLTFVLAAVARDAAEARELVIPPGVSMVHLEVVLEPGDDYPSYRTELSTTSGRTIATPNRLVAHAAKEHRTVSLSLPARILSQGDYELSLSGVTSAGERTPLGYYYFRIKR